MKKILLIALVVLIAVAGFIVVRKHNKAESEVSSLPTFGGAPPISDTASGSGDNTSGGSSSNTSPATKGSNYTAGTFVGSLNTADGRTRTYLIHIPTGYTAGKTYPLVFLFHGGGKMGTRILQYTQFDKKADDKGFIVVAPEGIKHNWNDGRGTTDAELAGVDDVAFIRQLAKDLSAKLPIDQKRMYATGPSNGGMMTERLGCDASDLFAAIAPDVGPLPSRLESSCKPGPISVIGIQGSADPGIPIDGGVMQGRGDGGEVLSARATMQFWAAKANCNTVPQVIHQKPLVNDGTSVDQYTFSGCTAGTSVVYYIVQGMGHSWPPLSGNADTGGPTSQNIDATDVVWDFFAAHPKQ